MANVQVNPEILRWARETAGLTLDKAAKKLQIHPNLKKTGADKLSEMELGIGHPSRPLLLKMSKQYHRSILTFYLEEPPIKGDRGQDFRQLPQDYAQADEGLVDALVRDIRTRQNILRAAIEDEEEARPLPFVGSMNINNGLDRVRESILATIKFDLAVFREQRSIQEAFAYLRSRAEASGMFVLIMGDLGSHHTKIPVEAFRGFALADKVAPFVIINDQDAKSAWSFTLFHELAHIWLGQTGISGEIVESNLERFCDDVASAILLPDGLQDLNITEQTDFNTSVDLINRFSSARKVSSSMVAYKLYRLRRISFEKWSLLRTEFKRLWLTYRKEQREAASVQEGGPNYYIVKRYRVGKGLVELVSRMTLSGTLTSTKAGKVLGVKPRNVFEFITPLS